ncbi:MAG: two-component sensor histidine kinase [Planctomycetaceae bacterium]|nr:two-component sensor histidine kinase [Planctomycetaceae bacterium]
MSVSTHLEESERQRLLDQYAEIAALAGALAHEIKNPLSTISMNLELLTEDLNEGDIPQRERMVRKVSTVQKECGHLQEILDDFLQFARVGELELTESDLNQVVTEFIEFFQPQAAEYNVEISPHLASGLPRVKLDQKLIRQILMNLALNAQQAMPDGGRIEIQTLSLDGEVQLVLIDDGAGMNERTRDKIFDIFYSTKSGGSGLGLPTVRKIVTAHHGTISCESELERGTRFQIAFPVADR